jgi:hypothetical protein
MRRFSFEAGLAVLVLVAHLYAVLLPANSLVMEWFSSDDAFYYFKTAQNITEGHGITFDGLGRDSGFHPLWMVIITPIFALARYDRLLPLRLVVALSALLSAAASILLYRLAKRFLNPYAAAFVALFWAFYPFIHIRVTEMGMESAISAFFIILLIYWLTKNEETWGELASNQWTSTAILANLRPALITGVIATLAVFSRLDNIFLVLIAGAWLAFRPVRLRYLLLSDIALITTGVLWSYMMRIGFGAKYAQYSASSYWMLILAVVLRIALYYFTGLYNRPAPGWKGLAIYLARIVWTSMLASALLSGLMVALQALHVFQGFPRQVLVYEAGIGLAALIIVRLVAWLLSSGIPAADKTLHWKPTFVRLAGYFTPIGLGLIVYMASSLAYFGTFMPVSGQIKRWWGTLPNTIYGRPVTALDGMLGLTPGANGPWSLVQELAKQPALLPDWLRLLLYVGIALVILIWQWKRTRAAIHALAWFPLAIGSFIQVISYTGTGYLHMRSWYWTSDLLTITLILGVLIDQIACLIDRAPAFTRFRRTGPRNPSLANALILVLCAGVILYGVSDIVRRMPMYIRPARAEFYLDSIREMENNTEPGSLVGSTGGGVIAYFVRDRTIVNMDGLMNTSEYFHMLQKGQASQYLDRIGLDYVYTGEMVITDSDPYFQFRNKLVKMKSFGGATLFKWRQ